MESRDKKEISTHGRAAELVDKDGKAIVTNRLTGNFPGSPIELEFVFIVHGDKIVSLEIRS